MAEFPADIFTEPAEIDPDTRKHLGPLAPMAGIWEGTRGSIAIRRSMARSRSRISSAMSSI